MFFSATSIFADMVTGCDKENLNPEKLFSGSVKSGMKKKPAC